MTVPRCRVRDLPRSQIGNANLDPWTEAKVHTKNPERGPLIIEGEKDHTVPGRSRTLRTSGGAATPP